jgi:aminobenzoyl-glutamate utilization protein B
VAWRILGTAYPQHMNKTLAETMHVNIQAVGLPTWSDEDQALARAVQRELKVEAKGLPTELGSELEGPPKETRGGGSDDIGDVSWTVPTITLRFPANVPDLPGHSWANAVAMATPIAHKGVTAGAKAQARTVLDLLLRPELVEQAWAYFRDVQAKEAKYQPFITDKDPPATHLNRETQERFRPELRKHYFDPSRYGTYLEQLGVRYPTLRPSPLP